MIDRRSLLCAGPALVAAPAIVRASSLMALRPHRLATGDRFVPLTERWGDLGVDADGREVTALAIFAEGKLVGYREIAAG
jgi:hypothetical protein